MSYAAERGRGGLQGGRKTGELRRVERTVSEQLASRMSAKEARLFETNMGW
jgi:hypothetical protein